MMDHLSCVTQLTGADNTKCSAHVRGTCETALRIVQWLLTYVSYSRHDRHLAKNQWRCNTRVGRTNVEPTLNEKDIKTASNFKVLDRSTYNQDTIDTTQKEKVRFRLLHNDYGRN
jgi:hypothetical protein